MSTKQLMKPALPVPVVKFFVCEDLRQELNGMVSAIGLYPDNVIGIGIPDEIPEPTAEAPVTVRSLNFLFNFSNLPAKASITIEVETNGKRNFIQQPMDYFSPDPGKSMNMITRIVPAVFHSFGKRKVFVTVGGVIHEFSYEIRRMSLAGNTVEGSARVEVPVAKSRSRSIRKVR
jgi:hypothetical protein